MPEGASAWYRHGLKLRGEHKVWRFVSYSSDASGHTNYPELDPTSSELSRNHRENEEEDAEEAVPFKAMQAHLDVNIEEAKKQIPALAYNVAVLTA